VAKAWTCPACGTRNLVDETECSRCGRWASVFDLEETVDVDVEPSAEPERSAELEPPEDEWRPIELGERSPEPVMPSGPRPTAAEAARTVLDSLRGRPGETAEAEQDASPDRSSLVKWIVAALALLWFVLVPLLDALR
jgi:hypothetical protein